MIGILSALFATATGTYWIRCFGVNHPAPPQRVRMALKMALFQGDKVPQNSINATLKSNIIERNMGVFDSTSDGLT